jgi:hypothetical protein
MEKISNLIEQSANYEGNDSLLLFERIRNDEIRRQIVDLQIKERVTNHPDITPSRDAAERTVLKDLENMQTATRVHFEDDRGIDWLSIKIGYKFRGRDTPATEKQMSITEAHEKGHNIRNYIGKFYDTYFRLGFDLSAIKITDEDISSIQGLYNKDKDVVPTREEAIKSIFDYVFSGHEIAERMSQLKNYFGFIGNEEFTKEHLDYARIHYIADTGIDNQMTYFFQAITLESEIDFLRLINSSGI